jgi:hypothetical protein
LIVSVKSTAEIELIGIGTGAEPLAGIFATAALSAGAGRGPTAAGASGLAACWK